MLKVKKGYVRHAQNYSGAPELKCATVTRNAGPHAFQLKGVVQAALTGLGNRHKASVMHLERAVEAAARELRLEAAAAQKAEAARVEALLQHSTAALRQASVMGLATTRSTIAHDLESLCSEVILPHLSLINNRPTPHLILSACTLCSPGCLPCETAVRGCSAVWKSEYRSACSTMMFRTSLWNRCKLNITSVVSHIYGDLGLCR